MVRSKLGEKFPSCRGDFCSNSVPDFFADWTKNGTLLPDALTVVSHDQTLLFALATRGHAGSILKGAATPGPWPIFDHCLLLLHIFGFVRYSSNDDPGCARHTLQRPSMPQGFLPC